MPGDTHGGAGRPERPRIGVSACLLGQAVRYDGGHKRDRFLTDTLGEFVDWVPVCPEVECGLPVPRESMRLVGDLDSPRLVAPRSGVDHTDRMQSWAAERVGELESEALSGFIFKTNSPSSGMRGIRVYDANGVPRKAGVGMFARAFMEHFPLLPVEDDGRLHDPGLRENFVERVFALQRYRDMRAADGSVGGLVAFHARHKYQLMAHNQAQLKRMGQLVAHAREHDAKELFASYESMLLHALETRGGVRRNVNVLTHMLGYFSDALSADEKRELLEVIDQYRAELVPLIVPVTLVRHYVRKYDEPYLKTQTYLDPHPVELKLRNHA